MSNRGVRLPIQQLCAPHGERAVEVEHYAGSLQSELTEAQPRHAGAADGLSALPFPYARSCQVDHHTVWIRQGKHSEFHRLGQVQDQPGPIVVLVDPDALDRRHGQCLGGGNRRDQQKQDHNCDPALPHRSVAPRLFPSSPAHTGKRRVAATFRSASARNARAQTFATPEMQESYVHDCWP
ncbi:MAG: hypothetical protein OXK73_04810 [Rhodospirillaceae bacterium]|nr:hypothetical protein [Rhodospirillaceae bacterium]